METRVSNIQWMLVGITNLDRIIVRQININYIRSKFDILWQYCQNNLDILLLNESKLDSSFPDTKLYIGGYAS